MKKRRYEIKNIRWTSIDDQVFVGASFFITQIILPKLGLLQPNTYVIFALLLVMLALHIGERNLRLVKKTLHLT